MPYATVNDFGAAFGSGELFALQADRGESAFAAAQAAAMGIANGYLATRYAVPIATVPAQLRGWTLDIARWRLYDDNRPEPVELAYRAAIAQLRDIADGRAVLTGDTGTPLPGPADANTAHVAPRLRAPLEVYGAAFDLAYVPGAIAP